VGQLRNDLKAAEREKERTTMLFDLKASKLRTRHEPLGQDRFKNRYWFFDTCPKHIFVEQPSAKPADNRTQAKPANWNVYSRVSEVSERNERAAPSTITNIIPLT